MDSTNNNYEKIQFSGKIFMYHQKDWEVIYPIVELIKNLKEHTLIGYSYGKGNKIIKLYGTQYNHRLLGYTFENTTDYKKNLKMNNIIITFSDVPDKFIDNLINYSKSNNKVIVCYSMLDNIYYLYDYSGSSNHDNVEKFDNPLLLINKLYELLDFFSVKKFDDLFKDFDLINIEPDNSKLKTLEECKEIIAKREKEESLKIEDKKIRIYDPTMKANLAMLRKYKREKALKNLKLKDDLVCNNQINNNQINNNQINNNEESKKESVNPIKKNLLNRFFTKK